MKIGISGAGGYVGGNVLSQLASRATDDQLVALSRSLAVIPGIESRFADFDQPDSLEHAYHGLDRLLIIPGDNLEKGVIGAQLVHAIDAALEAHVGHIYLLSAAHVKVAAFSDLGASYLNAEEHLKSHARHWTILRMNFYTETFVQLAGPAIAQGVLTGLGEDKIALVSRDDVAQALAGAVSGNGQANATYELTGPHSLSGEERARLLQDLTGKPVKYQVISEQQLHSQLAGLPPYYASAALSMQKAFALGAFDTVTADVEMLCGHAPAAADEILRRVATDTTPRS
ncbi:MULTISPECIES: NAD(P)H-binding protein [unclassified Pseudomonas]|uniref:NAD(P)H-binding protein n=1 Tax=unclassified Pseudomonas TaxID=196821 RepID=UPI0015A27021|nr:MULTISPECIES: NAD(P)H-binding protein [unclassified Pseudomonas]NWC94921.1 NAD(P)H-binding protein [Pseudomonas sp. IPO3779]NWD15993.1 NAD(P)H-binding protein [Pseudomonas sp. IPO3778]